MKLIKWLKKVRSKYFDYRIVGEYYDRIPRKDGSIIKVKKYIRKWYLKKRR